MKNEHFIHNALSIIFIIFIVIIDRFTNFMPVTIRIILGMLLGVVTIVILNIYYRKKEITVNKSYFDRYSIIFLWISGLYLTLNIIKIFLNKSKYISEFFSDYMVLEPLLWICWIYLIIVGIYRNIKRVDTK